MAKIDNFSKDLNLLLYITLSILILLLSISNLQGLRKKEEIKVLGAEKDNLFWEDFATKHPTYMEAWIELGRIDKAREIDPNFDKN